jgi:colicin import membrane protein
MRNEILVSGVIHGTLLAAMFVIQVSHPIVVPGPEIVQVSLVEPGPIPMPAQAPPPRVIRSPDVAPELDDGVRIEKPTKKPDPKPEPEPEPPPPEKPRVSTPALPSAAMGSPGLRGDVALDASDFEFTYYLILVRNQIAQNWTPPAGLGATPGLRSVVYFRIHRDGSVSPPQLETPSTVSFFDRAAMRAVTLSDPLPPLPLGYPGRDLGVHFGFEFTPP